MSFADAQAGGTVYALAAAIPITLAGTVSKGDLLGFSTGWKRADGDTGPIRAKLVALEDGVSGNIIKACPIALVGGRFTDLTAGALLYAGTDAGKYQTTASTAAEVVAVCITTTEALVFPVKPAL